MKYLPWLLLVIVSSLLTLEAKRLSNSVNRDDSDFEFVNENAEADASSRSPSMSERKKWKMDPSNNLCKPLNCKKKELCLLEDAYTAVCVSKKELHRNKDEIFLSSATAEPEKDYDALYNNDDEKDCKSCPPTKPVFLCGNDNKTYSSLCRLNFHNCLHGSLVKVSCKGFCPCPVNPSKERPKNSNAQKEKRRSNSVNRKYTFIPEDINYDNKHYKFIKINQVKASKKDKEDGVSIFDEDFEKTMANRPNKLQQESVIECREQQLVAIGNRLLDWFSVIMGDTKSKHKFQTLKGLSSCKVETRWMFGHLDVNSDGALSKQELFDLEHDKDEQCIRPFLEVCDLNQDRVLDPREWCRCFEKADRSCAAVRRRLNGDLIGTYAPDCDDSGFYRAVQCHKSVGICWCVDKHGVEFANTRTRDKPNCDGIIYKDAPKSDNSDNDEDDDDNEDDENAEEGSAGKLLVF